MDQRTRERIRNRLADKLEKASGRSVMEHGVKAWDTAADTIIDAIIEIIIAEDPRPGDPRPEEARS